MVQSRSPDRADRPLGTREGRTLLGEALPGTGSLETQLSIPCERAPWPSADLPSGWGRQTDKQRSPRRWWGLPLRIGQPARPKGGAGGYVISIALDRKTPRLLLALPELLLRPALLLRLLLALLQRGGPLSGHRNRITARRVGVLRLVPEAVVVAVGLKLGGDVDPEA